MKKKSSNRIQSLPTVLVLLTLLAMPLRQFAQKDLGQANEKMSYTFDQFKGTNASAIAWHPEHKAYYAVIAGNTSYPMEVFDASGKTLKACEAGFDFRGLWWNPKEGSLEGNGLQQGLESHGIVSVILEGDGKCTGDYTLLTSGDEIQPSFNAVGAYHPKMKQHVYYNEGELFFYKRKAMMAGGAPAFKSVNVNGLPVDYDELNETTVVYTGLKGMDFGLWDYVNKRLYLLNKKGVVKGMVRFPNSTPSMERFGFSYANGLVWLYDTDSRTWKGYSF